MAQHLESNMHHADAVQTAEVRCGKGRSEFKSNEDAGEREHGDEGVVAFFVTGGGTRKKLSQAKRFGYSYDGDAASVVHISTDGVAAVAFVHDDLSVWPYVRAQ